ncbi:hypothetical protein [Bradyrhizobium sp. SRS-191]|uniref:hypothetical protein n=1 Tax=Bradyrhizobium sp. SRS-191 TaxID=2962606 RepID=UPI00211DE86C|nr:hypothetical protein [Bradyrhizobium sp. SRS-191]
MRPLRLFVVSLCVLVTGCGTFIPSQRDWPNDGTGDVANMNTVLVRSIVCELSYAVTTVIETDVAQSKLRPNRRQYADFLYGWGVEVAADLTVTANTGLASSGLWAPVSPASAVFTLGGGIGGGFTATNANKFNIFYTVADLYKPAAFKLGSTERPCRYPEGGKEGSLLVDIDLRVVELLWSRSQIVQLRLADSPGTVPVAGAKNVLTQTVSIKESVSGDITPAWKFTTGSVNQSSKLFNTGRDRTHQLVITFGPLGPGQKSLNPLAEQFHLNEQLKAGLRDNLIGR